MSQSGIVSIHGKEYQTVAKRVADFRSVHADYPIETEIVSAGDIVVMKATIRDPQGKALATGYAEEVRNSTNINKTSALENCETSAVGRALAFFGYGGTEIASANEVSNAIIQQAKQEVGEYFVKYNEKVRELWPSIGIIKDGINTYLAGNSGDPSALLEAAEAYFELSDEEKMLINLAPSKGGIFTTKEREVMKSSEFRAAYFGDENE